MKGPNAMAWDVAEHIEKMLASMGFETHRTIENKALEIYRNWNKKWQEACKKAESLHVIGSVDRMGSYTYGMPDIRAGIDESYLFETHDHIIKADPEKAAPYEAAMKIKKEIEEAERPAVVAECEKLRARIPEFQVSARVIKVRVHAPGARKSWNDKRIVVSYKEKSAYLPVKYPSSMKEGELSRAINQLLGKIPPHPLCSCGCGEMATFDERTGEIPNQTSREEGPPFNPLLPRELFEKLKKQI